jgi:hypothetical protein
LARKKTKTKKKRIARKNEELNKKTWLGKKRRKKQKHLARKITKKKT